MKTLMASMIQELMLMGVMVFRKKLQKMGNESANIEQYRIINANLVLIK